MIINGKCRVSIILLILEVYDEGAYKPVDLTVPKAALSILPEMVKQFVN